MKLTGVNCAICNHTVLDNGTKCVHCGTPYPPEVLQLGRENHEAVRILLDRRVDPTTAVAALKVIGDGVVPTMDPKGSGLLGQVKYWADEFYTPPEGKQSAPQRTRPPQLKLPATPSPHPSLRQRWLNGHDKGFWFVVIVAVLFSLLQWLVG